ncbi:MAG: thiol:disulfide interchange protein DsbA/DsbL [Xanthomonadales bacterium]|nr:thiol:disulfide interchange protein DsbA/DsbL [Xanthomonadales bacterium]
MTNAKNFNTRLRIGLVTMLTFTLMLGAAPLMAQGGKYQEGLHYFKIDQAGGGSPDGQVEVIEAFSYLCPHCNTFEPFINSWLERKPENVKFTRMPVIFGRKTWELYARAYVTADMMGIADEAHGPLMDALYKEKRIMRDMEELAEFYSQFGVTASAFEATSESFAVDARLRKDQRQTQAFGVSGTPSMIVNGKYMIKGSQAVPNYDTFLSVVDYLIAQETAAMASNDSGGDEASPEGEAPAAQDTEEADA